MGRIISAQNYTAFAYESGTYANTSGAAQWIGQVTNFESDDTENVQRLRYHGTSHRNVGVFTPGASDHGGTFEYYPQDFRMLGFMLGSMADATTGSPAFYTHAMAELNGNSINPMTSGTKCPFISFTVESAQRHTTGQNLVRTYKGAMVDEFSLTMDGPSEPLKASVKFIAKECVYSSGTGIVTAPTELARRPYIPSDTFVHVPSGTKIDAKTWVFTGRNNIDRDGAHVCNGSTDIEQPNPTQREYEFGFTMQAESSEAVRLYGLYKSGGLTTVEAAVQINNFGGTSGISWIPLSGCVIDAFDAPNPIEGINEWSLTLIPRTVTPVIQDNILKYLY